MTAAALVCAAFVLLCLVGMAPTVLRIVKES